MKVHPGTEASIVPVMAGCHGEMSYKTSSAYPSHSAPYEPPAVPVGRMIIRGRSPVRCQN